MNTDRWPVAKPAHNPRLWGNEHILQHGAWLVQQALKDPNAVRTQGWCDSAMAFLADCNLYNPKITERI